LGENATEAGTARLTAALAAAGVGEDLVADRRRLTGGTFNAVHRVGLTDGSRLVVKIPPGPRQRAHRTYHNLIMWVEAVPRQCSQERRGWLYERVFKPLAASLDSERNLN
jgi:hypothetical protein